MVKLQIEKFRYVTSEQFRVLTAVEMGMKNHELVPEPLVAVIASLKHAEIRKTIMELCRLKVLVFERFGKIMGYRLTQAGYDFLALRALSQQNVITSFGNQIGVGKESDVYVVREGGMDRCLKLHRLGTTSFRAVNSKRDYIADRKHASWLYLARIAAQREYSFLRALHARGFSVPQPIALNRNAVVMQLLCDCVQLNRMKRAEHASSRRTEQAEAEAGAEAERAQDEEEDFSDDIAVTKKEAESLLKESLAALTRLAAYGLVHGDFNEFNLMINPKELRVWVIDLPQATSRDHMNAAEFFERDVRCVERFFKRRFGISLRRRETAQKDDSLHKNESVNADEAAAANQPDDTKYEVLERPEESESGAKNSENDVLITLDEIVRTDWLDCEIRASGYDRALRKRLIDEGRISSHYDEHSRKSHGRHEHEPESDEEAEAEAEEEEEEEDKLQEQLQELQLDENAQAAQSDSQQSDGSQSQSESDSQSEIVTEGKSVKNRVSGEAKRAKQREQARHIKRKWDSTANAQKRREMRDTVKQSLGPVWY